MRCRPLALPEARCRSPQPSGDLARRGSSGATATPVVSRIVPSKVDGASCRATQPARRPDGAGRGCRRAPRLLRRIQPAKLLEVAAPPPLVVGSSTLVSGPELVIRVCHHRDLARKSTWRNSLGYRYMVPRPLYVMAPKSKR